MDNGVTYGRWLRGKRGRKGAPGFLSQSALAERVGVQRTYINQIENGRIGVPDPPLRQRIHAALGTSDDELVRLGLLTGAGDAPTNHVHDIRPRYDPRAIPHFEGTQDAKAEIDRILADFDRDRLMEVLSFVTWVRDRKPVNVPVVLVGR